MARAEQLDEALEYLSKIEDSTDPVLEKKVRSMIDRIQSSKKRGQHLNLLLALREMPWLRRLKKLAQMDKALKARPQAESRCCQGILL